MKNSNIETIRCPECHSVFERPTGMPTKCACGNKGDFYEFVVIPTPVKRKPAQDNSSSELPAYAAVRSNEAGLGY